MIDLQGRTSEIFRIGDAEVHPVLFSTAVDEIPRHPVTGKAARFVPERS